MKKLVAYVIAEVEFAPTFEWVAESNLREEMELIFFLMNPGPSLLEERLRKLGCRVIRIPYAGKKQLLSAFLRLIREFRKFQPSAVHTHLMAANLVGLPAAWIARVPRRIYTRHHSNQNFNSSWYGRFYDQFTNIFSTKIVATCLNLKELLNSFERVPQSKVEVVYFGFDQEKFAADSDRIEAIKAKYSLKDRWPVVGVISRYTPYKGIPFILEAFEELLKEYPSACLVLANAGQGKDREEIQRRIRRLGNNACREIAFETDCPALMRAFDVFVHVPVDRVSEAFGQVYVESMLCERPSVFTLSGIAPEFVRDGENALVVPFRDSSAILKAIRSILSDELLRNRISNRARSDAASFFRLDKMIDGLREIYR